MSIFTMRDSVAQRGIPIAAMVVRGFGKAQPIASNATAAGRQRNRRVELVVSGEAIGTTTGGQASAKSSQHGREKTAHGKPLGVLDRPGSTIGILIVLLMTLLPFSQTASAQKLELDGAYAHITGDLGLNGYNVGAALWFSRRVSLAADYDSAYKTAKIGTFELTSAGEFAVKNHIQDFLVGPRIYFPGVIKSTRVKYGVKYGKLLVPFAEAQFGVTHLNTTITQVTTGSQSASDTAFSWMLGGGADYILSSHWAARAKLGLLRTHLADAGQSRLRLGLGVAYTFGTR